jgi:hypothetical protein
MSDRQPHSMNAKMCRAWPIKDDIPRARKYYFEERPATPKKRGRALSGRTFQPDTTNAD